MVISRWHFASERGPRNWRPGWDRESSCPPDVLSAAPRSGWRPLGPAEGETYRHRQDRKRIVIRVGRKAGYIVRNRWQRRRDGERKRGLHTVPRYTYEDGPCAGLEAVDPWEVSKKLSACQSAWYAQARITAGGELRIIGLPRGCGLNHVCPQCAGTRSAELAAGLRDIMAEQGGGQGALLTLTQRALHGESLHHALERLRDGMRRLWTGRPKEAWCAAVPDWYYGIEVTRGAKGAWWHLHTHVVVRLEGDGAELARWIGGQWERASAAAAESAGCPGFGWDPAAGGVKDDVWIPGLHPAFRIGDPHGWFRPIDLGDPVAVYQACKYPSPCVELDPLSFAEFLSASYGRRWHDGGGAWRGAAARADQVGAQGAEDPEGFDIGENIARCGPSDCPALDDVAPAIGLVDPRDIARAERRATVAPFSRWQLADYADIPAIRAAAAAAGGSVVVGEGGRFCLELPTSVAAGMLRSWVAATQKPVADPEAPQVPPAIEAPSAAEVGAPSPYD